MKHFLVCLVVAATGAFGQYKTEPASAPPVFASEMQDQGAKVLDASGKPWAEVWFRKQAPSGPKNSEDAVTFPSIPHGALIGVIRFAGDGADRRGQVIKSGVYTLRYSLYPVDGAHQGVAPQRDFLVLVPAAEDKDPASTPAYDPLMDLSRKASGTPHPAVLEIYQPAAEAKFPSLEQAGEDWAYNVKVGDVPMSLILIGKTAH
jgi:hypothetical protein